MDSTKHIQRLLEIKILHAMLVWLSVKPTDFTPVCVVVQHEHTAAVVYTHQLPKNTSRHGLRGPRGRKFPVCIYSRGTLLNVPARRFVIKRPQAESAVFTESLCEPTWAHVHHLHFSKLSNHFYCSHFALYARIGAKSAKQIKLGSFFFLRDVEQTNTSTAVKGELQYFFQAKPHFFYFSSFW